MTRLLIAAAVAALAVPAVAQVAQVAPPAPMATSPMKPRGPMADGVTTLPEIQARIAQLFQRRDANRDGALTQDELAKKRGLRRTMAPNAALPTKRIDPTAAFNRIDSNKDGMISRDEFASGRQARVERRMAMRGPDGMKMKMRHHGMFGARMLSMADANKDSRVTLTEAQGAAARHFTMADTNRDGRVTRDEMRAMREKMGGMGHHG